MFAVVSMISVADRYSLAILLEPIKRDLGVTDTAMGVLTGGAQSLVFATAGVPLARLVDTRNRRNLIAVAVAFWSGATALSGAAVNFVQMFFARAGVSSAESIVQPAFVSMVGDLFAPARRGLAMGVCMMGGSAGIALGAFVAGTVAERYDWRTAFFALGLPGLLFALLFWLTVPEPPRGGREGAAAHHADTATVMSTFRYIATVPTAWRLIMGSTLLMTTHAAWGVWLPTFFLRVHHMSMAAMSASFGTFMGLSAMLSMLLNGFISDRLARAGEGRRVAYVAGALVLGIPFMVCALLTDNIWLAWGLIVLFQLITAGAPPAVSAAGVGVVHPRARGLWMSVHNMSGFAVGGICGPLLIGMISDHLTDQFGAASLRYGLLAIPGLLIPSALSFYWASRSADRDARRLAEATA